MRRQPPHQTNTVLSWVGWSWLKRTKGEDCRLTLSVNYSLSRRTRMFSRPPGPMSESCVMRLTMDSKSTGNPIRAGAATILFCIFVTRREVTFADFSGVRMLTVNRHGRYWLDFRCLANAMSLTSYPMSVQDYDATMAVFLDLENI